MFLCSAETDQPHIHQSHFQGQSGVIITAEIYAREGLNCLKQIIHRSTGGKAAHFSQIFAGNIQCLFTSGFG